MKTDFPSSRHGEKGLQPMKADKHLRAIVSLFRDLEAKGTLEQGQMESIVRAIMELRRALRSGRSEEIRASVDRVASVVLRSQGR